MGTSSSIMASQELSEFRKLNPSQEIEIPAPSYSRRVTDKKGFIIFGVFFVIFLPFFIYTLAKSDIRRFSHGHDSCGNLCGISNEKIDGLSCSGQDYTDKPYEYDNILNNTRRCSDECPSGQTNKMGTCFDEIEMTSGPEEAWNHVNTSWWKFLITALIAIGLCLLILVLMRYVPALVVWGVLIAGILMMLVFTGLLWYSFSNTDADDSMHAPSVVFAILFTIADVIILIVLAVLFKKIRLVIALFKETARSIFAMPVLLLLPVITAFIQVVVLCLLVVTTAWMVTGADLVEIKKNNYDFVRNGAMEFAMLFNIFMAVWALQFFAGCQYMVSAGSVANWFFLRNQMVSPICTSFTNTLRFHLGTVLLGSFILTLVAVIKAFVKSLIRNDVLRRIVDCCIGNIEAFLKFLSKNAYIETAIHGQSFCRSGKRAAQLLLKNAYSVVAINSVGDFVLAMSQIMVLGISTGISYAMFSNESDAWLPTLLSAIINLSVILVVFAVFEATVDTLFVCFCEDKLINDGVTKPYCMSKNLMQFVEESKKMYKEKK